MVDIPLYTKSKSDSVAPVGAVTGFQNQATGETALGAISSSLYDKASKQLAAQAGQQAAERGEYSPLINVTGADAEYVGAYKETAFQGAYTQSNRLLKQLALAASDDPEGPNIEALKSNFTEYMHGISASLPPDVYKKLEQSLAPQLDTEFYSLLNQSNINNNNNLRAQNADYLQIRAQNVLDLASKGNLEAARAERDGLKESGGDVAKEADAMYTKGAQLFELQTALNKGDSAKVDEIAKTNPESSAYIAQYEASKRSHEAVNYLHAQRDLVAGASLGQVLSKYELNSSNRAKIELKDAQNRAAASKKSETTSQILGLINSGEVGLLSSDYSSKDIDNAYDDILEAGGDNSLGASTLIAANFPIPISKYQKRLEGALKNGSAEEAIEAAGAVQQLSNLNANALSGMSDTELTTAFSITSGAQDTTTPLNELVNNARGTKPGMSLAERQQQEATYKAALVGKHKYTNPVDMIKYLQNNIDSNTIFSNKKTIVPAKLVSAFSNLMTKGGRDTNDPDIAANVALTKLNQRWRKSTINNRVELGVSMPDHVLPNVGNFIQNSKYIAMGKVAERNRQAKKTGNILFMDVEYPNAPHIESAKDVIFGKSARKDDTIIVDGFKTKLIVQSDDKTNSGSIPSWPLFYLDKNGLQQPILEVDGSQARWVADYTPINTYQKASGAEALDVGTRLKAARQSAESEDFILND